MAILKIARMGHPVLRRRAEPVADPTAPDIRRLVGDMTETLEDIGGAGLAAPQVHRPLRLVIFQVPAHRVSQMEGDTPLALTALINPEIEPIGTDVDIDWEGCLSVPGLTGAVQRFRRIAYRGLDLDGKSIAREVAGFHARVVQHECDHLDGVLYPMRMKDLSLLMFVEEMRRHVPVQPAPAEPGQ